MLRIKPSEVVAAYKKTGFEPYRGSMRQLIDMQVCACGMGVMLSQIDMNRYHGGIAANWYDWAADVYGDKYSKGFIDGFDGSPTLTAMQSEKYCVGYCDGLAAAQSVEFKPF